MFGAVLSHRPFLSVTAAMLSLRLIDGPSSHISGSALGLRSLTNSSTGMPGAVAVMATIDTSNSNA
jgi:hypothetical protein